MSKGRVREGKGRREDGGEHGSDVLFDIGKVMKQKLIYVENRVKMTEHVMTKTKLMTDD